MKILKNKLLFILCFIFLMIPNVKAQEQIGYDDEGNPYKLLFSDTPLKNFVKRDFAMVFNELDYQGQTIAKYTYNGINAGYAFNKELIKMIFETSEEYKNQTGIKYVLVVMQDYYSRSTSYPYKWTNHKVFKNANGFYSVKANQYQYKSKGSQYLNFNENSNTTNYGNIEIGWSSNAYGGILIKIYEDGEIERVYDLANNENSLMVDIRDKGRKNIFYSSVNVYDTGNNIIHNKEEFLPKRNTPHADYSLGCDENNPFIYNIYFNIDFLEKNDNVKIYKEDKLLKDVKYVYNPEETETITIENAETGYYKIDVFDENNDLLYSENFHIDVKIGDIFDENDTPTSLLDKIKMYLKGFKKNINMFYEGFENFFSSLNFELRTGIFIITTIFIIVYIIKIIL